MEVHPFSPALPRIDTFEVELCEYVQASTPPLQLDGVHEARSRLERGKSIQWVSSLFAILACASQFYLDGAYKRQEKSRLFRESHPVLARIPLILVSEIIIGMLVASELSCYTNATLRTVHGRDRHCLAE